jgi:hypothetical protein
MASEEEDTAEDAFDAYVAKLEDINRRTVEEALWKQGKVEVEAVTAALKWNASSLKSQRFAPASIAIKTKVYRWKNGVETEMDLFQVHGRVTAARRRTGPTTGDGQGGPGAGAKEQPPDGHGGATGAEADPPNHPRGVKERRQPGMFYLKLA